MRSVGVAREGGRSRRSAAVLMAVGSAGVLAAGCSSGSPNAHQPAKNGPGPPGQPHLALPAPTLGSLVDVSKSCARTNAEVEQAADPVSGNVYVIWIGCHGIGFARSTDGGRTYAKPVALPGSVCPAGSQQCMSWDPAIALGHNGRVYTSFMTVGGGHMFPVVDVSSDQGRTFPQVARLVPPAPNNWGDRAYIAVSPTGAVYLTWDYGPHRNLIGLSCPPGGSCSFSSGDLNGVVQKSTDGGKTWSPPKLFTAGYPASGFYGAPMLVEPNGRVDAVEISHRGAPGAGYKLGLGYLLFTSSVNGTDSWSPPLRLGPATRTMSLGEWWIDGSLASDSAGNLYATWDTQGRDGDIGWISYSTDDGRTWSPLSRVTPDNDNAVHIVEVAAGPPGIAFVAWLTDANSAGYALYLRPFSITKGWLSKPLLVSTRYGSKAVWPGDTFGMSVLPGPKVLFSWGIGVGRASKGTSQVYAASVSYARR